MAQRELPECLQGSTSLQPQSLGQLLGDSIMLRGQRPKQPSRQPQCRSHELLRPSGLPPSRCAVLCSTVLGKHAGWFPDEVPGPSPLTCTQGSGHTPDLLCKHTYTADSVMGWPGGLLGFMACNSACIWLHWLLSCHPDMRHHAAANIASARVSHGCCRLRMQKTPRQPSASIQRLASPLARCVLRHQQRLPGKQQASQPSSHLTCWCTPLLPGQPGQGQHACWQVLKATHACAGGGACIAYFVRSMRHAGLSHCRSACSP